MAEANYFMADMEQREPLPTPSHSPIIPFIQSRLLVIGTVVLIYKMCIRNLWYFWEYNERNQSLLTDTHEHTHTLTHTHREREGI